MESDLMTPTDSDARTSKTEEQRAYVRRVLNRVGLVEPFADHDVKLAEECLRRKHQEWYAADYVRRHLGLPEVGYG